MFDNFLCDIVFLEIGLYMPLVIQVVLSELINTANQ